MCVCESELLCLFAFLILFEYMILNECFYMIMFMFVCVSLLYDLTLCMFM